MNVKSYYVGLCKICKQGHLEIVKDIDSQVVYICCDECEAEWLNVENALENINGSRGKFGLIEYPSDDEIESKGWKKYIRNAIKE